MIGYNGFGDHYSFTCLSADTFAIIEEANDNLKISYSYNVLGTRYDIDERISGDLFRQRVGAVSSLPICYNNTYPGLSYIQGTDLAVSREKTGVIISMIFLALISIIYLYAKRDYWIQKYKAFFRKLSATNKSA